MYEAMRQRAPNSTKLTGAMTAMMLTLAAGYALSAGFAKQFVKFVEPITTVTLVEEKHDQPPPPKTEELKIEVDLPTSPLPPPPQDQFEARKDRTIAVVEGPGTGPGAGTPPPPLPPAPSIRKAPKLMPGPLPEYPTREIRAQSQGTTELSVCVGANGRVTSASVATSSGHTGLDDAALKWVKTSRFTPGTLDGAAQAVCGHAVSYEWNIKDAGK